MKRKLRITLRVIYVLVLFAAIYAAVNAQINSRECSKELSRVYQEQVVLSPEDCKLLARDLQYAHPLRLAIWASYFDRAVTGKIVDGKPVMNFAETTRVYYDQYAAREKPGRSNYFGLLLCALAQQRDSEGLTLKDLAGYLGDPDVATTKPGGKTMVYRFTASGTNAVGIVEANGNTVSNILVSLQSP